MGQRFTQYDVESTQQVIIGSSSRLLLRISISTSIVSRILNCYSPAKCTYIFADEFVQLSEI